MKCHFTVLSALFCPLFCSSGCCPIILDCSLAHSDYPKSLNKRIPHSQAFSIKITCSTLTKYEKHCNTQKKQQQQKKFIEKMQRKHSERLNRCDRQYWSKRLVAKKEKSNKDIIPCLRTYNTKLPIMRKIISKK